MRPIALMYHDVIEPGGELLSGFTHGNPMYKIETGAFRQHLDETARRLRTRSVLALDGTDARPLNGPGLCFTFDDGGVGSVAAARMLDERGWKGHFFIATDWIDRPGFLREQQIHELRRAGHVIGSHSCSHPERMSHLDTQDLVREWSESARRLASILGEEVRTASVPNGYYSREVARAASLAGIRLLFTSEPTVRIERVDDCVVLGRYTVHRKMSATLTARLAADELLPRSCQAAVWNAKKLAKRVCGKYYLTLRTRILSTQGSAAPPSVAVPEMETVVNEASPSSR